MSRGLWETGTLQCYYLSSKYIIITVKFLDLYLYIFCFIGICDKLLSNYKGSWKEPFVLTQFPWSTWNKCKYTAATLNSKIQTFDSLSKGSGAALVDQVSCMFSSLCWSFSEWNTKFRTVCVHNVFSVFSSFLCTD